MADNDPDWNTFRFPSRAELSSGSVKSAASAPLRRPSAPAEGWVYDPVAMAIRNASLRKKILLSDLSSARKVSDILSAVTSSKNAGLDPSGLSSALTLAAVDCFGMSVDELLASASGNLDWLSSRKVRRRRQADDLRRAKSKASEAQLSAGFADVHGTPSND